MVTMAPESAVTIDTEGKASIVLDLDADGKTTAAVTEVIVVQLLYGSEPKAITNTIAYDVVLDSATNNSLTRALSNGNKTLTLTYSVASGKVPGATKLTIHLASGNDCQSTLVIPIIHNIKGDKGDGGSPGTSPYSLTPQYSAIPVQCEAGGVISDAMSSFEVELTLRQGVTKKAINSISSYSLTVDKGSYAYPTSTSSLSASVDKLKLTIPAGTTKASIAPFITIVVKSGSTVLATCSIAFPIGQKGLPGDTEATIHVLRYFNGIWESGKTYYYTDTTAPIVKLGNSYYTLNDTAAARSGVSGSSYSPTNSTYWTEVSYRAAEWMEMFFANFARLGSAVFFDRFLFSAYGSFRVNGSIVDNVLYDDPDVIEAITGTIGGSTDFSACAWEPYFWVNLSTGKVYMENAVIRGSISTPMVQIANSVNVRQLSLGGGYNVAVQPRVWYEGSTRRFAPLLLTLPSASDWQIDGTETEIVCEFSAAINGLAGDGGSMWKSAVMVCADGRFLSSANWNNGAAKFSWSAITQVSGSMDYSGFFSWNGKLCKCVLLKYGQLLKLKLVRTIVYQANGASSTVNLWYIENASDFTPITSRLVVPSDITGGGDVTLVLSSSTGVGSNGEILALAVGSTELNGKSYAVSQVGGELDFGTSGSY